jgi:hypothetical protein
VQRIARLNLLERERGVRVDGLLGRGVDELLARDAAAEAAQAVDGGAAQARGEEGLERPLRGDVEGQRERDLQVEVGHQLVAHVTRPTATEPRGDGAREGADRREIVGRERACREAN